MKLLMLIFWIFHPDAEVALQDVRVKFHQSTSDESTCKSLITLLKPYNEHNNPLYFGYRGCANMVMAKHVFNPFSKLSYFNRGRKMLESAISRDGNNVELRFLRYTVQTNVPALLNYSGQVATDREFLQQKLPSLKDQYLKKIITTYLKQNRSGS